MQVCLWQMKLRAAGATDYTVLNEATLFCFCTISLAFGLKTTALIMRRA
jgi:hypothetical protein